MPQLRIQLQGYVPDARLPEALEGPFHALAAVAHWVHLAGDEQHRDVQIHPFQVFGLCDEGQSAQHFPEQANGGISAAEGVGHVAVHVVLIERQPVEPGAVGGEALVVGAEGQLIHQGAGLVLAHAVGLFGGHRLAPGDDGGGHLAGAHDDRRIHGAGIADQVGAGQEGTHGVAHQEIGDLGEFRLCQVSPLVDVVYHPVPAAPGAEVQPGAALRHGLAVAQVIMACHGEAPGGEIFRKGLIAQDVLGHAVGNLQNSPGLALRQPLHCVDGSLPVGGEESKFVSDHGKRRLLMI